MASAVSMKSMGVALCLSVLICACVSQRPGYDGERPKPSVRFKQACPIFQTEKIREKVHRCTWAVLDKVADLDEKVNIYPYQYMRRLYRWSRNGMLCYADGNQVVEIRGPCDAMELSCSTHSPKTVDHCWRVVPKTRGPVTPRPNPPQTPRGRGI